jgi:hypothetical protein
MADGIKPAVTIAPGAAGLVDLMMAATDVESAVTVTPGAAGVSTADLVDGTDVFL